MDGLGIALNCYVQEFAAASDVSEVSDPRPPCEVFTPRLLAMDPGLPITFPHAEEDSD
jgi:hypothetical protein